MAKGWRKQWRWARADMKALNSAMTIGVWASADGDLDQHSGRGHGGRWQDSSEALEGRLFRTWR